MLSCKLQLVVDHIILIYKKTHAVCNAKDEFTLVDIGEAALVIKVTAEFIKRATLGTLLITITLKDLLLLVLLQTARSYPYVFVANDAFQLKYFMLKPFARLDTNIERKILIIDFQENYRKLFRNFWSKIQKNFDGLLLQKLRPLF